MSAPPILEPPRGVHVPAGPPGVGPAQDHGRACLLSLGITVAIGALGGAIVALGGLPQTTTDAGFIGFATALGFAFCGGQAAMVTGFMAMKQRQSPLWVVPALVGLLLGLLAFVALFGLSMYLGAVQAGLRPF